MPIALAKGDTFKVSLRSDQSNKEVPVEQKPRFEFNFLTGRQQRKLAEQLDQFTVGLGNVETIDKVFKILGDYIVGWENIIDPTTNKPIPFDKNKIMDVLRFQEANELLYAIFGFVPELEMLKNLESQLPFPTAKSVEQEAAK